MTADRERLPYRPAAGVMLLNHDGRVFVAQRLDSTLEAWQMPQGGLDKGEKPWKCALREVEEETGIPPHLIERIARHSQRLRYDLPPELAGKLWKGKWRGQDQDWFLARFTGTDADVDIATEHAEFNDWKWVDPAHLPDMIVPFKRDMYRAIIAGFGEWLG